MHGSYWMKITPRGIVYQRYSWKEWFQTARIELAKIILIVRSEVRSKGFEKTLGMLFLTLEPIMMAFVYYILTYIILASRTSGSQFVSIYIAVVMWRWMSKTVDGSPTLFPGNAYILKQTNFPVVSVLLIYVGVEFVNFFIAFAMLFVVCVLFGYYPQPAYAFLIFPMLAEFSIIMLLTILFSIAGVFVRDLQGLLYSVTGIWFYLSPGIYPVENVPAQYLWLYYLNPFAHILPAYQGIMMRGEIPDIAIMLLIAALATTLMFGALVILQRVRYNFFSFI
jgi:lipopolysaccharide transport system permease protein